MEEMAVILTKNDLIEIGKTFDSEPCHCGQPTIIHPDRFTRGLCQRCDDVRCDAYPGECGR